MTLNDWGMCVFWAMLSMLWTSACMRVTDGPIPNAVKGIRYRSFTVPTVKCGENLRSTRLGSSPVQIDPYSRALCSGAEAATVRKASRCACNHLPTAGCESFW